MISSNTRAIIELAWSRRLGLPDEALNEPFGPVFTERAGELTVLQLWDTTVVAGPAAALERLRRLGAGDPADLADLVAEETVRRVASELVPGPTSAVTSERLWYAEDYLVSPPDGSHALIARDDAMVAALAAICPPDDVIAVAPQEWQLAYVEVTDDDGADGDAHRPLAGAGYSERVGLIGRLGALTAHPVRRRGHARLVAALALHDALDAGLVVEAGVSGTDGAGEALTRGLGFEQIGRRITVGFP